MDKDGRRVQTTSFSSQDSIETAWEVGTKMKSTDWRKQNVVLLIHSIWPKEVNAKMRTGGQLLTGNVL
jgi:hypothetical protein